MSYAISNISSLPFGKIIGGPMKAAINAQSEAAAETIAFIKEVGFKPKDDSNNYSPDFELDGDVLMPGEDGNAEMGEVRNVTFTYETKDVDGSVKQAMLTVPVLTIVSIPMLRIDELNIDFMAKISETITRKSVSSRVSQYANSFSGSYRSFWSPFRGSISASYSNRHSSTNSSASRYSTEMTMNVNVRAVQDEMPSGLSRVLGILEDIIKDDKIVDGEVVAEPETGN